MTQRHLDRYDNHSHRPWPVSPYAYPLNRPANGNSLWPLRVRAILFGLCVALGTLAIFIGIRSFL